MNAYELAINLDAESSQMEYGYVVDDSELLSNAATMLRHQADQIAELEQFIEDRGETCAFIVWSNTKGKE